MRKDTYQTVVPKILALTTFGTRVETAQAAGWKIAWSNGNRNWGRWMSPIKRGQQVNLDANQVIVYGPARYVDALCRNLPAPPIDALSAEARFDRGPEEFLSNPKSSIVDKLIEGATPRHNRKYRATEWVFHEGRTPLASVIVHPDKNNAVWLMNLEAITKGGGRKVMKLIQKRADALGVTLIGLAIPQVTSLYKRPMSSDDLIRWYKSLGWKVVAQEQIGTGKAAAIVRPPKKYMDNPRPPSPEEEWLGGEESEEAHDWDDPTHSPYEGDIPPWGQQGYEGEFPMESRVFYVNAYTQLMKERPFGSFNDNLQKYGTRHWVGTVRQELQMGADFDYVPFAAIPIRSEDAKRKDYFFTYLGNLSKALNLQFTHIVVQKTFPTANFNQRTSMYEGEVKFEDGRWFPYVMDPQFSHPEAAYMNAYVTNRLYGGPEEGGWWYDTGKPIAAIPFLKKWGVGVENRWNDYLVLTTGWESKFKLGSVLGRDNFSVGYEEQFPSDYPKERPHYE